MVDPKILEKRGSTQARLKEILTATATDCENPKLTKAEKERKQRNVDLRNKIEERIQNRLWESIEFGLKNYHLYSAVDLAWDSTPINKAVFPMILYAQGKLDLGKCATSLNASGMGKYIVRDKKQVPIAIDVPKFYETTVNMIRSVLTRRLAAQSNKYANLWPFLSYESRSTSLVGKLRAEVMSQKSDIVADNYGWRHHQVQVMRDMLLYCQSVNFIRSAWETEKQEYIKAPPPGLETPEPDIQVRVIKEGLCFVNPHPSRVFWDNNYPLTSINDDNGCEWIGYWDVVRYKDIHTNTDYWNRDKIAYSSNQTGLFTTYSNYFSQYYCTITPPVGQPDLTSSNDRKNNVGVYAGEYCDTGIVKAEFFWKIVPKQWGIGDYDYPVWTRFIVASDRTIQYAEFLPSTPAAVASFNANDNRQVNVSFAMELMGFQDQLTNLISYLLLCLQADNIKVMVIDTGVATPEQIAEFRKQLKGQEAYTGTTILEVDRVKLAEVSPNAKPEKVIELVETKASQIDVIFRAIGQLISLVERMAALSPQEQGQPAPREISATETNLIAGTTESVYAFVSDSVDEFRAAVKRIFYESFIAFGEKKFRLPAISRFPKHIIEAAGFAAEDGIEEQASGAMPITDRYTVVGSKEQLIHDYVFSSRDGAERPVNSQTANVMVQLLNTILAMPPVANSITKDQLYGIINEIFRLSGAGYDLKFENDPGQGGAPLGPDPTQQMMQQMGQMVEQVGKATEQNSAEIQNLKGAVEPVMKLLSMQGAQAGGPQMPQQEMPPQPPQLLPPMQAMPGDQPPEMAEMGVPPGMSTAMGQ